MTAHANAPGSLPRERKRRITAIFWINLACQIGIIATGGIVRLTKSGLGCSSWPHCEPGEFTPRYHPESGLRPFIEFGNRALTLVLLVFAILVLVATYKHLRTKGKGFVRLSWVPLILTVFQAVWGMLVVYLHLHPFFVSVHFIVSPILVASSAVLVYRLYEGNGSARLAVNRGAQFVYWPLAAVGFIVLILGTLTTGSGPHSGDANTPQRFPFNPAKIAWLHADFVWLFCGLLLGVAIVLMVTKAHARSKRALVALTIVTLLQAVIGYIQYFTGLPEALVGLHMLGAALLSASIAWLGASLFTWYPLGEGTAPDDHSKEAQQ